ncbi:MAG: Phosphate-specific transport system accessory protein PhoU [Anaerolineae bacterium]|nr:Phosphate-specific transport system accessory protein PhoU [Anaerolineae bacterium]
MVMRERFERELNELRADILKMGDMVDDELKLALRALETLDVSLAKQVQLADKQVNQTRFDLENKCTTLIVTQQPAARDLRSIIAAMNMIVDIERMGDQAKGIAKVIPHMLQHPDSPRPAELRQMGSMVSQMLRQAMTAYAHHNADLAEAVSKQDDEVDRLYAQVFTQIMEHMAHAKDTHHVEACYEVLRSARELERFGDLATNIAERVVYMVTGSLHETNVDNQ